LASSRLPSKLIDQFLNVMLDPSSVAGAGLATAVVAEALGETFQHCLPVWEVIAFCAMFISSGHREKSDQREKRDRERILWSQRERTIWYASMIPERETARPGAKSGRRIG
jgi:hypothetical protein